jgi:hypothetical protein
MCTFSRGVRRREQVQDALPEPLVTRCRPIFFSRDPNCVGAGLELSTPVVVGRFDRDDHRRLPRRGQFSPGGIPGAGTAGAGCLNRC